MKCSRLAPVLLSLVFVQFCENRLVLGGDEVVRPKQSVESWITFLSCREEPDHHVLYKMRPDGSQLTKVFGGKIEKVPVPVEGTTLWREPHWTFQSPNGKWFASYAKDCSRTSDFDGSQYFMIYVGSLDGNCTRVLAPDGYEQMAWSPDSTQIAYAIISGAFGFGKTGYLASKLISTEIVTIGIDSSKQEFVLEQPGVWTVQDWSPDGKKLLLNHRMTERAGAVDPQTRLVEYDLARARAAREQALAGQDQPRYGKISGKLLRGSEWPAKEAPAFLKPLVSATPACNPASARYSPDGQKLAFTYFDPARTYLTVQTRSGIVRFRNLGRLAIYDGTTKTTTTIASYPDGMFTGPICWSPDGHEILITRYLPDDDEREKRTQGDSPMAIWAITADGKQERFVTTGWSPDWH